MELMNMNMDEFTKEIASKTSVPGGGGASALAGAIGVALADMVGEFTVGKAKYAFVEDEIKELMSEAETLRVALLECVKKDAIAFEPLSKAYSIPKDTPDRDKTLEKCLKDAAAVPYEILKLCCMAIDLQRDFADKGSKLMISDAATGAAVLRGALLGAAMNVKVNTKLMKDRKYADDLQKSVDELVIIYSDKADKIFNDVYHG